MKSHPDALNCFTNYLHATAGTVSQGGSGLFFLIYCPPSITTCHSTLYNRITLFQNEIKTMRTFHSHQRNASLLFLTNIEAAQTFRNEHLRLQRTELLHLLVQ